MLIEPSQLGDWLSMAAAKCRQRIESTAFLAAFFEQYEGRVRDGNSGCEN